MLHPGPLVADNALDVAVEPGASPALDLAAAADVPVHAFLRSAWFRAAVPEGLVTLTARRQATGEPIAAIPLVLRRLGPLRIREVPGSYWPYRIFPLAADACEMELAGLLASHEARATLGRAWRVGPVLADDPTLGRLSAAARQSGWTPLIRRLGRCYVVGLERLIAEGPWPSTKTLRKNRWLERRLAESGALDFRRIDGEQWRSDIFDLLAAIEAESWVGRTADPRDTKFLNPDNRRLWELAVSDPMIAAQLACSILYIGGEPAAFTFTLRCGDTLHVIANSYSERFTVGSPGRVLLYRDFQEAAATGVRTIGWGAGDAGYKSEMGATAGPDIVDLLLVRGPLAVIARPFWRRQG